MGDRVEDRDYVVDAMRHDAVDEQLSGTHVKGVNVDEKEDSDDAATVRGAGAPPPYEEFWSQSVSVESAAEACGNGDAAFYGQTARMAFMKVHVSKGRSNPGFFVVLNLIFLIFFRAIFFLFQIFQLFFFSSKYMNTNSPRFSGAVNFTNCDRTP